MYDAIIVGARCAGAPMAMLLVRKGYRVLVVDRASFPSDTISTHIIWPHGAEIMDRWGVLDRLAATGCPPIALNLIFDVGPFALKGAVIDTNAGRGGFCPRRTVLDKLLVDAAVEAGAKLREEFTVETLVWDGDRVVGIKGHSRTGGTVEERARVVIGADGVHSLVAKAVRAPAYDTKPPLATNYYSYYSGFAAADLEEYVRDYQAVGCFPTHDGLTLIAVLWPTSRFEGYGLISRGTSGRRSSPHPPSRTGCGAHDVKRSGSGRPVSPITSVGRTAPGWALVGDAGYNKDPITAQGISDAFIDAEHLTAALDDRWSSRRPLDHALGDHRSLRDERVKPLYDFTCQLATLEPPPPHMQQLFAALHGNQEATNQFYSAITGSSPLPAFMNPENLERIMETTVA
jgi:2-polyprenyl-6-methoxyphenol hydroxylase-like FAD-dependent oxidoreductase